MTTVLSGGFARLVRASLAVCLLSVPALAQTPAPAAPADPNAVVATVNGEKLTEREVQMALEELAPGAVIDDQKREQLIGFLINVKLVAQAAKEQKIPDSQDFQDRLAFVRDKALMQTYLENVGKTAVSEDAVKKVYDETIKDVKPEQEVRARHILVESEDAAKKIAERIAKGEDFAAVAKEASTDPGSGAEGGDLGFFTKEQMVPEFAETAFKLKAGEVSAPVKSQFGWHVIKVEEVRTRPVPQLDEVRAQIEEFVLKRAQEDAVKKLLEQAKIERVGAKKEESSPTPPAK